MTAWITRLLLLLVSGLCLPSAYALTIEAPFASHYNFIDLGEPPGGIGNLGGITFQPGEPDTLLIGGRATSLLAAIHALGVVRDADGHITAFSGTQVEVAKAPGVAGGIDGGLIIGPGGTLLYTTYRDNQLGQIKAGSSAPDRLIDLTALGVSRSTGALQMVPADMPGGGRLKLLSFNGGTWYDATLTPAADGTFDVNLSGIQRFIGGGPEGVVYIRAGNPGFERDSVLVSEWSLRRVVAYEIDANGDPLVATRRVFISELSSAQGAAIDPVTGDFLFSNYAGDERGVIVVGGFAPPPAPVPLPPAWPLFALACFALGARADSRRRDALDSSASQPD